MPSSEFPIPQMQQTFNQPSHEQSVMQAQNYVQSQSIQQPPAQNYQTLDQSHIINQQVMQAQPPTMTSMTPQSIPMTAMISTPQTVQQQPPPPQQQQQQVVVSQPAPVPYVPEPTNLQQQQQQQPQPQQIK